MRAAVRFLQCLLGMVIGAAPVVIVTLSAKDLPKALSDGRILLAVVPGLAALYTWERYPYLAGGIASGLHGRWLGPLPPQHARCGSAAVPTLPSSACTRTRVSSQPYVISTW